MSLSENSVQDLNLEEKVISTEISPTCNLKCPECNVGKRLHVQSNERRNDPELVKKIIEHTPKKSTLLFVGLGEPTIPYSQERINQIISQRQDLKGYIQTNGSYSLKEELEGLIKQGRLEIGLSLDQQHFIGGQKNLRIQKEYVESISTIVTDEEKQYALPEGFPNLNRILISPLLIGKKIANSWGRLSETVVAYQELAEQKLGGKDAEFYANLRMVNNHIHNSSSDKMEKTLTQWEHLYGKLLSNPELAKGKIAIYTELPPPVREDNLGLFVEAEKTLFPLRPDGWRQSKRYGFYVDMEPTTPKNSMRILIDGNYIEDPILAEDSWQGVDEYSKPITDLPKIFDLETGRYE